jgi:hypothetical protein
MPTLPFNYFPDLDDPSLNTVLLVADAIQELTGEVIVADISSQLIGSDHVTYLKLAREVAMDIRPLADILDAHGVNLDMWEQMNKSPAFQNLLRSEVEAWNSATNTAERVKIKSLAFVEEALPEFYARAHDPKEPLAAKTDILKTVAKFAGVGGGIEGAVAG